MGKSCMEQLDQYLQDLNDRIRKNGNRSGSSNRYRIFLIGINPMFTSSERRSVVERLIRDAAGKTDENEKALELIYALKIARYNNFDIEVPHFRVSETLSLIPKPDPDEEILGLYNVAVARDWLDLSTHVRFEIDDGISEELYPLEAYNRTNCNAAKQFIHEYLRHQKEPVEYGSLRFSDGEPSLYQRRVETQRDLSLLRDPDSCSVEHFWVVYPGGTEWITQKAMIKHPWGRAMGGYPDRAVAEEILREAEPRNPGPWGNHSRTVAHCAEKIAEYSGMDQDKAYVLGLLHDIGRRFGKRHLGHVSDGYSYMMAWGYQDAERICLTHSFNQKRIKGYVGKFDTTEYETELIKTKLAETEYDDYDKLIQLCDAISGAYGVMDIIARMSDVKQRYGNYDPEKWNANIALKDYFEKKMGRDLYEAVEKDTFRPDMRAFRCEDAEWLCSEEAYAIYAPCMYQPTYEKYKAEMEGYLADPAVRIHVCENDGIKAGMLVLKLSGTDAEILGISVSEDCRGHGIGQYMVREVMKTGQLESLYAQTDDDAVEFYRKSGFDTEKTEVQYPNGTVVRYRCTLNNPKAANREG